MTGTTSTIAPAARDATWAERAATFAVFLTLGLGVGAWAAVLPAIKFALALSDRDLSVALLALAAGSILATSLTGMLAPRIGTSLATGVGALVWVAASALAPWAGTLTGLVAVTFTMGITGGFADVSVNGHAGHIEEKWGSPIMSSFHAAFSLGGLFGAALGGALAGAGCGSGGQLWIPLGVAGLLNMLALPFIGPGSTPQKTAKIAPTGVGSWLRRGGVGRTLLLLGLVASFCFVIEGAMADWSAIFLTSVSGSSVAIAATGYAAFAVAMAAGRFAGDGIVARFGAPQVLVWGGALAAGGLALAVVFPAPLVVGIGFAAVGIGLSNVVPVLFSVAARAGSTPAAGIAPVATFGYAGFLSGPPIIGFVASWAGLRVGLGCLVPAALIVMVLGRIAVRSSPSDGCSIP